MTVATAELSTHASQRGRAWPSEVAALDDTPQVAATHEADNAKGFIHPAPQPGDAHVRSSDHAAGLVPAVRRISGGEHAAASEPRRLRPSPPGRHYEPVAM